MSAFGGKADAYISSMALGAHPHMSVRAAFLIWIKQKLQRSNFYAPNVRLGMERTRHLHRLTLSGAEHDYCP